MIKKGVWFISFFAALIWIALLIISINYRAVDKNIVLFAFIFICIVLFLRFIFISKVIPYISQHKKIKRIITISLCISLLFVFMQIKFDDYYRYPNLDVVITATGEKNENALSSEVWIQEINVAGKAMDLSSILLSQGWELRSESLLSFQNQPTSISFNVTSSKLLKITLSNHPWSGIVQITTVLESLKLDLFADHNDTNEVEYNISKLIHINNVTQKVIFYTLQIMLIFSCVLFVVYLLLKKNILTFENENLSPSLFKNKKNILLSVLLIPIIPMMFLYNQNAQYLSLLHVFYVVIVLLIVSLIEYIIILKISQSSFLGLLFCILTWALFFLYGIILLINNLVFLLFLAIVILSIIFLNKFINENIKDHIIQFISIMVVILFVWNGIPITQELMSKTSELYKNDFYIDETLPNPNIYWFHCDGMLGFNAMNKYFGDPQTEFISKLESHGFVINHYAKFESGHTTAIALPALMSPEYYDSKLMNTLLLQQSYYQLNLDDGHRKDDLFDYKELDNIRLNKELVNAFSQKGYTTAFIGATNDIYFPDIVDFAYDAWRGSFFSINNNSPSEAGKLLTSYAKAVELKTLLEQSTMITSVSSFTEIMFNRFEDLINFNWENHNATIDAAQYIPIISNKTYCLNTIIGLDEVFKTTEPRLVLIADLETTHTPFNINEDGTDNDIDVENANSYPPAHRYASKLYEAYIKLIIENDPDAIIILQGDHGLHGLSAQQIREQLGVYNDEVVYDIRNSVISAVRIPKKYGHLDEPLNPLNITRYLINNYVGQNYEYLDPDESDLY